MTRALVTGAGGFVGSELCAALAKAGYTVRAALRQSASLPVGATECTVVGEIGRATDWTEALDGVDCVIHLAARVHMLGESAEMENAYMETNAYGTQRLAEAAAGRGVRRLVYLSSIKVNGERTVGRPFCHDDAPAPEDAYGRSKLQAERALESVAAGTAMSVVSVRPPLVYGSGVRANFLRLLSWVDRQLPLPLGAVRNQRSLISVWNLCDLIVKLVADPQFTGTCLAADGESISTPELIRRLARAMQRRALLVPVPLPVLRGMGRLAGRREEITRLCDSLVVDAGPTFRALDWRPPLSTDAGLSRTAEWYLKRKRHVD
jgi:UDP-N-acetyl-alpha-D-quinovosamine dehydrogenase